MVFVDVNTFYGEKAGGIRTYHHAKISWFQKHPEHTYYLIGPGPRYQKQNLAKNVFYVQIYGKAVTKDPKGYRILLNVFALAKLIYQLKPDVLESGDPWVSGPMALCLKKLRLLRGVTASFYHSDPIRTYFEPWTQDILIRKFIVKGISILFFQLQRRYDVTITASKTMQKYLEESSVEHVRYNAFGAPALFFERNVKKRKLGEPLKLLYSGRLDKDKGIMFFQEILPLLLEKKDIEVVVMGRGKEVAFFQNFTHSRYTFKGYVGNVKEYHQELSKSHFFLAMGPWETFGLGALEAMAAGLGIIGVDQGGVGEILQELPAAFSFRYGDYNSFNSALIRAKESSLEEVSTVHSKKAEEYGTWEKSLAKLEGIYRSLVL